MPTTLAGCSTSKEGVTPLCVTPLSLLILVLTKSTLRSCCCSQP